MYIHIYDYGSAAMSRNLLFLTAFLSESLACS